MPKEKTLNLWFDLWNMDTSFLDEMYENEFPTKKEDCLEINREWLSKEILEILDAIDSI